MKIRIQLEHALKTDNPPISLDNLVKSLLKEGISRTELLEAILKFRTDLFNQGRYTEEDYLVEIASALEGWCHSDYRI